MVLTGDQHAAVIKIFHRMIGTVMTGLHLHRLAAAGEREQLMPRQIPKVGVLATISRMAAMA